MGDENGVETRQTLMLSGQKVCDLVLQGCLPLPIIDEQERSQQVTLDALMTLCCTIPGTGFLAIFYMFHHHAVKRRNTVYPSTMHYFSELVFWAVLMINAHTHVMVLIFSWGR